MFVHIQATHGENRIKTEGAKTIRFEKKLMDGDGRRTTDGSASDKLSATELKCPASQFDFDTTMTW